MSLAVHSECGASQSYTLIICRTVGLHWGSVGAIGLEDLALPFDHVAHYMLYGSFLLKVVNS